MKRLYIAITVLVLLVAFSAPEMQAQFRSQEEGAPRVAGSIVRGGNSSSLFGFINPENFHMQHSYTMSYMMAGGRGLAVGMYTNSMYYRISEPLDVQVDVSMMHSPYNSFNNNLNDFSGLFISRAELNYRPSENFRLQIQYQQLPYNRYGSPFYNPWYYRYGY